MEEDILDDDLHKDYHLPVRRRKLLPVWIKIFCWLFMILGCFVPISILSALFHLNTHLEIFGLESNNIFSGEGLFILLIMAVKGVVAYGLWSEKRWAVQAAIFDGIASSGICIVQMVLSPYNNSHFSFRFEIFLIIPYLLKLKKIREDWEREY